MQKSKVYYEKRWMLGSKIKLLGIYQKNRRDFIISCIKEYASKSKQSLKILDVGCGTGWLTKILSKYGWDVTGIDLTVKAAKKMYPNIKFIEGDFLSYKFDARYDVIVCSEVIEHIATRSDQQNFIRKCFEILNDGDILILTTPNKLREERNLKMFSNYCLQPIENWLDKQSLISLLQPYFVNINFWKPDIFNCSFLEYLVIKYRGFMILASIFFNLYKLFDRIFASNKEDSYLAVVAQKVKRK